MAGQTYSKKMIIGGVLLLCVGMGLYFGLPWLDPKPPAQPPMEEAAENAPPPAASEGQPEPEPAMVEAAPEAEPKPQLPTIDVARVDSDGAALIAGQVYQSGQLYLHMDGARLAQPVTPVRAGEQFVVLADLGYTDDPQVLRLDLEAEDGAVNLSGQQIFLPARPKPADPKPADPTPAEPEISVAPAPEEEAVAAAAPPQSEDAVVAEAEPSPEEDAPAAVQPTILADADGTVKVLGPKVDTVALDTIQYDLEGEVELGGRAAGDGFVRVYLDNTPVTTSKITVNGAWSMTLPQIDTGVYTLRVDELDTSGAVTSRVETPFKRESPATLAEFSAPGSAHAIKEMTVQPGTTLWALAVAKYGDGSQFMKVFAANRDRIKNPNLVYPGQIFDLPD